MLERFAHQRRLLGHGTCDLVGRQHEEVNRTWQRAQRRQQIRCSVPTLRIVASAENNQEISVGTGRWGASYQGSEQDNPLDRRHPLVRAPCGSPELTDSVFPVQVSGAGRRP